MSSSFQQLYFSNEKRFTYNWTSVESSTTAAVPDESSTTIEVPYDTESIQVQLIATSSNNSSSSIDLNILSSTDDSTYDTVAYDSDISALAAGGVQTTLVTPGIGFIKPQLDNNDADDSASNIQLLVLLRG